MFTAIGVGVKTDGTKYAVKVNYFDDRVTPNKLVATQTHVVGTKPELVSAVQSQLAALKAADKLASLDIDITGKVLGTI